MGVDFAQAALTAGNAVVATGRDPDAVAKAVGHTDDLLAVQEGALYPALARLHQKGWIKAEWARSELNKEIKVYELTAKGRKELAKRMLSWQELANAMTKVFNAR